MENKDKELFKIGVLLGNALATLNEVQFNTILSRTSRTEFKLFNSSGNEVTETEVFDIDINNNTN